MTFDVMTSVGRIGIALVGIAAGACVADQLPDKQRSRDDVIESVFRYQFEKNGSLLQRKARVYCIALDNGSDPDDHFMERFAHSQPPVRGASACTTHIREGVREKGTNVLGLLFWAKTPRWTSDTEVEVDGGYYEDGRSAAAIVFFLRWDDSKWKIVKTVVQSNA